MSWHTKTWSRPRQGKKRPSTSWGLPGRKKVNLTAPPYIRHTAISMYLAKHKHEGEAASWAGNSPNVIHRRYKGLVKEADANEYWNMLPSTVKSKILKFLPQAAA